MSNFTRGVISGLVLATIANTVLIEKLDARVSKVEKKGEVEAFLEPLSAMPVKKEVGYRGPRLYNNHTKIVFNDSKEFTCLAENIYYEARGEPYIGKIAVAHTTFNRAEKSGSFCDVVHAPNQFSWTLKTQDKPQGREWEASKHAAKMFVNGVRVKNLENTDHYHANYVDPYWNVNMKKTGTIGNHIFFASK